MLVDTLAKAFGLEEILHEQRDRPVTLELDPDGYLFSYIQTFSDRAECVLPDRADMTYATHCLRSYVRHVHDVALRRGADVATPPGGPTSHFVEADDRVAAEDLLQVPRGRITEQGMRENIRLVLQGAAQLVAGQEPATRSSAIELCRAQLWQWVHHETGVLDTGRIVTVAVFDAWLAEELDAAKNAEGTVSSAHLDRAAALLGEMTHATALAPSLVDAAYRLGR